MRQARRCRDASRGRGRCGGAARDCCRRIAGERGISVEEVRAESLQTVPLKAISTPEDIANMALFLASDQARTITGQAINVDAGWTLGT